MRSYQQYCALAKALDVVGDRWTLLIVRELLLRGACRYTDLRHGLPGIATNLLATRLRALELGGVVQREAAPPPIATTVFQLTSRGRELEPVLRQLGRWGAPLLGKPKRKETFQSHWLLLPMKHLLRDHAPDSPPMAIEVRAGDEPLVIEASAGSIHARTGSVSRPTAVLAGPPALVLGLLGGRLGLDAARAAGLRYEGDPAALGRLQPRALSAG